MTLSQIEAPMHIHRHKRIALVSKQHVAKVYTAKVYIAKVYIAKV